MSTRKPFLLRLDVGTFEALQAWASDDLRSVNGQVEYLLRSALRAAGRLPVRAGTSVDDPSASPGSTPGAGSGRDRDT